jgi:hypothetical protein
MDASGGEGIRERLSARGEEALAELAQALLESPLLNQAVQVAAEARERASAASATAMRNVGVPSTSDLDRFGRRLRAVSERLEAVEDALDRLEREVGELRRRQTPPGGLSRPPGGP